MSRSVTETARDLAVVVALVGAVALGIRFLGSGGGIDPAQTHTIDSLRTETVRLAAVADTTRTVAARQVARVDAGRAADRARARADSLATARRLDSLAALLPDTATVVPRSLHEAIVAEKDQQIAREHQRWLETDAALVATRDTLAGTVPVIAGLQRQARALQVQVNDLERKANRRWGLCPTGGYGVTSSGGAVHAGPSATIGICYRLR